VPLAALRVFGVLTPLRRSSPLRGPGQLPVAPGNGCQY